MKMMLQVSPFLLNTSLEKRIKEKTKLVIKKKGNRHLITLGYSSGYLSIEGKIRRDLTDNRL